MAVEEYRAPPIEDLLANHIRWSKGFTQSKPLGIEKAVAIVTCMDGRLLPAEQAAARHHDLLIRQARDNLGVDLSGYNMLPIGNSSEELAASVEEDVKKLRASPLISPSVAAYGYVYDTQSGELAEIVRSPSRSEGIQPSKRKVTREGLVGEASSLDSSEGNVGEGQQPSGDVGKKQESQDSNSGRGSDPSDGGPSESRAEGDSEEKPESVKHLAEALKEAHVDDPDPPAAQP